MTLVFNWPELAAVLALAALAFALWMITRPRVVWVGKEAMRGIIDRAGMAFVLALVLTGPACTTQGPRHVATAAEKVAQSALIAVRVADQALYDQGLITVEKHRAHQQALYTAFDLHEQAVKLTLLAPEGQPTPAEYALKVQQALIILEQILADLPKSPAKDQAAAVVKTGVF